MISKEAILYRRIGVVAKDVQVPFLGAEFLQQTMGMYAHLGNIRSLRGLQIFETDRWETRASRSIPNRHVFEISIIQPPQNLVSFETESRSRAQPLNGRFRGALAGG